MKENEIKRINKILYKNVFIFCENYNNPFNFISIHSFCIDKNGNPLIFDFGLHRLFLPYQEITHYFFPSPSELNIYNHNLGKINVMNYGVVLLLLITKNEYKFQGEEITLPNNINISNEFISFLSKCLDKIIDKRYCWSQLGYEDFIRVGNNQVNQIFDNKALLDNNKLKMIFDSFNNKYEFIINYYDKCDFRENIQFIEQIVNFLLISFMEIKTIYYFFNRALKKKSFQKENEIFFVSINDKSQINKLILNFANPLLYGRKIIEIENNNLIKEFVDKSKSFCEKLEKLISKIEQMFPIGKKEMTDYKKNFNELIDNLEKNNIQKYFFKVLQNGDNEVDPFKSYNQLCLAEYLSELIIIVYSSLYDENNCLFFNQEDLLKHFYDFFGDGKKIRISQESKEKKNILTSFIGILFMFYKNNNIKNQASFDRQSIIGIIGYYPYLMNRIDNMKKYLKI